MVMIMYLLKCSNSLLLKLEHRARMARCNQKRTSNIMRSATNDQKSLHRCVRYKARIAYDGTHFQGFQYQARPGIRTVQVSYAVVPFRVCVF